MNTITLSPETAITDMLEQMKTNTPDPDSFMYLLNLSMYDCFTNDHTDFFVYSNIRMEYISFIIKKFPRLMPELFSTCTNNSFVGAGGFNTSVFSQCCIMELIHHPETALDFIKIISDAAGTNKNDLCSHILPHAISMKMKDIISYCASETKNTLSGKLDMRSVYKLMEMGMEDLVTDMLKSSGTNYLGNQLRHNNLLTTSPDGTFSFDKLMAFLKLISAAEASDNGHEKSVCELFNSLNILDIIIDENYTRHKTDLIRSLCSSLTENEFTISNVSGLHRLLCLQNLCVNGDMNEITDLIRPLLSEKLYVNFSDILPDTYFPQGLLSVTTITALNELVGEDRLTLIFSTNKNVFCMPTNKLKTTDLKAVMKFRNIVWEGKFSESHDHAALSLLIIHNEKLISKLIERRVFNNEQLDEILECAISNKKYDLINSIKKISA